MLHQSMVIPSHCLPTMNVLNKQIKTTPGSGPFTLTPLYTVATLQRKSNMESYDQAGLVNRVHPKMMGLPGL
jgi:hypothetical protein